MTRRRPTPAPAVPKRRRRAAWVRVVLPLSLVLAILFLIPVLWEARPGSGPGSRAVSPSGAVAAAPRTFIWTATPKAAQYRFQLFDDGSRVVYEANVADTVFTLPEDALGGFAPSAGSWRVVPLDRRSNEMRAMPPQDFRVGPG